MQPLGAQISQMLKDRGTEVIFGIPGVHNIELYRGLQASGLTHILARHEQGAAFMADGYARASGRPGVCYTITGPGFLNALTALGQAHSDSVPVLAIASCLDDTEVTSGQLHQMRDQQGAGQAVCDWSITAKTPDQTYKLIDRALSEFGATRPRPKAVHVPIGVLGSPAAAAPAAPARPRLPQASHDLLYHAINRVLAAQKPLFVFGGGCRYAGRAAARVLRQTGAAGFMTYAGRGVLRPTDRHSFGSYLARPGSAEIFAKADLVIAIGTELAEVDLWRPEPGHSCPMIRVDIDPAQLSGCGPSDLPILAEAAGFLQAMSVAIAARIENRAPCWDLAAIASRKTAWRSELCTERPGIVELSQALQAATPGGTLIYSDMTQFAYGALEVWDMPAPGMWHHPSGFGTLGYALPAAIGGAVACPDRPVMAIIGDYGVQYTLPELATAVELGLPLPIILWDNGALGEIHDAMVQSQIAPTAVSTRNPDFLALAAAYGAYKAQPKTLGDLKPTLHRAFSADAPTLIRITPDILSD